MFENAQKHWYSPLSKCFCGCLLSWQIQSTPLCSSEQLSLLCVSPKQKKKQAVLVTLSKLISFCLCVNSKKNSCHFGYSEDLDALTSVFSPLSPPISLLFFSKSVSPQKSVKEGILLKQTSSFQRWKRRYFKLRGRTLYYAKDCKVQECVKLPTAALNYQIVFWSLWTLQMQFRVLWNQISQVPQLL